MTASGGGTAAGGGSTAAGGGTTVDAGSQGAFVAVGYGGHRMRTTDGKVWTNDVVWVQNGGDDNYLLRAIAYGDGKFDAVGYRVTTSVDGEAWVDGGLMGQWIGGLAYAKGLWVAAGGYGRRTWSTDGVTWHDVNNNDTRASRALAYDAVNERWIAVGDNGLLATTYDGGSWAFSTGDAGTVGFGCVGSGNGITIAVAGKGAFISHNGGASWVPAYQFSADIDRVEFTGTQFVAIGQGHAFTSVDGLTWADHTVNNLGGGLACHAGTCVAASDHHAFRSTDDGVTWTPAQDGGTGQYIISITYGSW